MKEVFRKMDRRKALVAIGAAAISATALPAAEKKEPYGWYIKWYNDAKCHCFMENGKDHWAWFIQLGKQPSFTGATHGKKMMPAEECIECFVKYLAHENATDIEVIPLYK